MTTGNIMNSYGKGAVNVVIETRSRAGQQPALKEPRVRRSRSALRRSIAGVEGRLSGRPGGLGLPRYRLGERNPFARLRSIPETELSLTLLSVNQRHLKDARKIDPVLAVSLVVSFKIIAATP
jgi:hypothetical protein